ncbi:carbohydrate ABC transporter permease [Halanaerobium salsuginis]|jgi:multiple sugar transport system permease protein|uniref:Multiple sugar transport system permease protein n=1 Tax=Halanaerobium salsuginis TaxID=29563 RepID=A0A1I4MK21_9FIRM|nr:sugar ABC transporter permease [Halanaerobium salsuginis]SFM03420.1 multiple sugar transport system permease protein [Halanaerobium salsuginis]
MNYNVFSTKILSSKKIVPYLFIAPGIIILAGLIIYPTLLAVLRSFNVNNSFSIANYLNIFTDKLFWFTLKNTFLFSVISVLGHYILGLLISLLINKAIYARSFFRISFLVPWMFPAVVPGIIWRWLVHGQFGILNEILVKVGMIDKYIPWLASPDTALILVILANVWRGFPIFVAVLLAGLQTVPGELYNAADVDGANILQKFLNVTMPHLKAVSVTMILVDLIWQFNSFAIVQTMTKGGPANSSEVLATFIYKNAFNYNNYEIASALGIVLLLVMLIPGAIYVSSALKDN